MRNIGGFIVALMLTIIGCLGFLFFQAGRQASDLKYLQEDMKAIKCNCKCKEDAK